MPSGSVGRSETVTICVHVNQVLFPFVFPFPEPPFCVFEGESDKRENQDRGKRAVFCSLCLLLALNGNFPHGTALTCTLRV